MLGRVFSFKMKSPFEMPIPILPSWKHTDEVLAIGCVMDLETSVATFVVSVAAEIRRSSRSSTIVAEVFLYFQSGNCSEHLYIFQSFSGGKAKLDVEKANIGRISHH